MYTHSCCLCIRKANFVDGHSRGAAKMGARLLACVASVSERWMSMCADAGRLGECVQCGVRVRANIYINICDRTSLSAVCAACVSLCTRNDSMQQRTAMLAWRGVVRGVPWHAALCPSATQRAHTHTRVRLLVSALAHEQCKMSARVRNVCVRQVKRPRWQRRRPAGWIETEM